MGMDLLPLFPVLVVALASALLYATGRRRLGLDRRHLRGALAHALEAVGLAVIFLIVDLAVSVALALLVRAAGGFVSLYLAVDGTLVVLALLQALVFQRWWERGQDG
jgi:hypothetical protein